MMEDFSQLQSTSRFAALRSRWVGPLLFGLLLAAIATFAMQIALSIPAKTDLSYPEGAVVARAWAVAQGKGAYADWRVWPHQFAPYGPALYYPVGWLARAIYGIPNAENVYTSGRLITFASLVGIAAFVMALGRGMGLKSAWPIVALGLMLHWTSMLQYVQSVRPDAPEVCASLAAIWIAAGGAANQKRISAALACLALSMWIKPTAWGETIVIGLWIARSQGLVRTAAIFIVWGAINLGAAWALDRHWGGLLFLNMIGSLDNGWTMVSIKSFLIGQGRTPYMLLMAAATMYAAVQLRSETGAARRLIFQAQLATLAVCLLQLFKNGADKNYFLAAFALSCVVLGDALSRLWTGQVGLRREMRELALWLGVIPYAALQLMAFATVAPRALTTVVQSWTATSAEAELQQRPRRMLTTYPHLAVTGRHPDTILDYIQYGILVDRGKLSPGRLLEMMKDGELDWIALPDEDVVLAQDGRGGRDLYTKDFWPTLFEHYYGERPIRDFRVFKAKPD